MNTLVQHVVGYMTVLNWQDNNIRPALRGPAITFTTISQPSLLTTPRFPQVEILEPAHSVDL